MTRKQALELARAKWGDAADVWTEGWARARYGKPLCVVANNQLGNNAGRWSAFSWEGACKAAGLLS